MESIDIKQKLIYTPFRLARLAVAIAGSSIILFCTPCQAHTTNLLQAYQQAANYDPTYQRSLANNLATGFNVGQKRADLLPQLSGSISANKSFDHLNNDDSYSDGARLSLSQTIFDWKKWKNLSAAKQAKKSAELDNIAQKQHLIRRLSNSYFSVSLDQRQISLDKREIDNEIRILQSVNKEYSSGNKYRVELDNAQSSLARTRANKLAHEIALVNDRNSLRRITGQPATEVVSLKKIKFIKLKSRDLGYWLQLTIKNNFSINSARLNLLAARENIQGSYSDYMPNISANANYNYGRNDNNGILEANSNSTTISLNLNWKLWQSGKNYYNVKQKQASYLAAKQSLELEIANYSAQCRSAFNRVIQDEAQIQLNKQVAALQKQAYNHTVAVNKKGISQYPIKSVLDADESYYAAEYNLLKSEYDYLQAIILLREAAGNLNINTLAAINRWMR